MFDWITKPQIEYTFLDTVFECLWLIIASIIVAISVVIAYKIKTKIEEALSKNAKTRKNISGNNTR